MGAVLPLVVLVTSLPFNWWFAGAASTLVLVDDTDASDLHLTAQVVTVAATTITTIRMIIITKRP